MNFVNVSQKKYKIKMLKSQFYYKIYRNKNVLVCHDFHQCEIDTPRTDIYLSYTTIITTKKKENNLNNIILYTSHCPYMMYNMLNMIPQQIYILAKEWIIKNKPNYILTNVERTINIDSTMIKNKIKGHLVMMKPNGFIDSKKSNTLFFCTIISKHKSLFIKIEYNIIQLDDIN